MDLTGREVTHVTYGKGKIVSIDEREHVLIDFWPRGQKLFSYPDVFDHYAECTDPEAQSQVEKDLAKFKREGHRVIKL